MSIVEHMRAGVVLLPMLAKFAFGMALIVNAAVKDKPAKSPILTQRFAPRVPGPTSVKPGTDTLAA